MQWQRGLMGLFLSLAALLAGQPARADVKPHALIGDGMVLQRDMKVPIWGTAGNDEEVAVKFQGQVAEATATDGKWLVHLENLKPGGPFEMTIQGKNKIQFKHVYVGDVWICSGQSNMEWPLSFSANAKDAMEHSRNANIRLFTVPKVPEGAPQADVIPQANVLGKWLECNPQTSGNFSAVAYFFGRDLQKSLKVPIGLIHTSWGGTPAEAWASVPALVEEPALKHYADKQRKDMVGYAQAIAKYLDALAEHKDALIKAAADGRSLPPPPPSPASHPWFPGSLYNGMIAPLIPYGIRGAIWYQGESNAGRAYEYRTLLAAMIRNWRADWKQGDFPFLIVQLAPFMKIEKEPKESEWAELREAQLLTALHVPRTAVAVITDVGEQFDIHPRKKEPVGARLALAARALANGEAIEYSGPIYRGMKIEGSKVHLSFDHLGGGLTAHASKDGKLTGFTMAGTDHKFVDAEAEIQGDTAVVWSSGVTQPVAVRYGWANFPTGNLWNQAGLPASPFRTDDFPLLTGPKK
ncbi:MAG TPA: sialate O-acetylesterase [Gemmataceae bacterium]|nr:sialate O-acetylesterase [Gemmataceae bacterium]